MFKLVPSPTFAAEVPLSVPGVSQPLNVLVTFKHQNRDALKAWVFSAPQKDDVELLGGVIVTWSGVVDEAGQPVPYNLSALSDLLANYSPSRSELFHAYLNELTEAKKKT
ncbi:MAG: phage tail assembly chaperone [Pseudomonadota bacterium]